MTETKYFYDPIPIHHCSYGATTEKEAKVNLGISEKLPNTMEAYEKEKSFEIISNHINDPTGPRNRKERRAAEKATRRQKTKKKKMYIDNIKEAAEKLAYINMIEKVRELNKQIEEEGVIEDEGTN